MSFTLQRLTGIASIALLSAALGACGGSDTVDATTQNAIESAGSSAKSAVETAGNSAKEAVESASGAAKEAVESAGSAAKAAVESAGDATKGVAEEAIAGAAAAVAAAGPDLDAGKDTYGRFCFSCHAAGVAGAPKLGDKEAWAPRLAKGLDMLVASTISGVPPAMPARGLCMNCSDDELRNTVAWMIAQ